MAPDSRKKMNIEDPKFLKILNLVLEASHGLYSEAALNSPNPKLAHAEEITRRLMKIV